jgi:hypothetical protein
MGLDITGLGSVFDFGSKVIDKIFPDKDAADKAKLEMLKLQQAGEFKELEQSFELAKKQIDVNAEEAKNANIFISGWRPFIGWVCGAAFAYNYVFMPFITYFMNFFYSTAPEMPLLDMGELTTLLFGMLGLGAMRTYEKTKKRM